MRVGRGHCNFLRLRTSRERHSAQLPQQAVWINAAEDEGGHGGAGWSYKIRRKSGPLREWICTDLATINQLYSKIICFFLAQIVLSWAILDFFLFFWVLPLVGPPGTFLAIAFERGWMYGWHDNTDLRKFSLRFIQHRLLCRRLSGSLVAP